MSAIGLLAVLTAVAVAGAALLVSGLLQPAPQLRRVVEHLQRTPGFTSETPRGSRVVALAARQIGRVPQVLPAATQLAVLGRTVEQHVALLGAAAAGGFVGVPLAVSAAQWFGMITLGWYAAPMLAIIAGLAAVSVVHASASERANSIRVDLRYQVSAYLDVVTMLLAGNTGYEGALEQAAAAGDGRLFAELRRAMRDTGARGASHTGALRSVGVALGLHELEQVAATADLNASEGAPVARTLIAKCASMRAALATDAETEARLRTSRLTTPLVGMALVFMALVMYPALNF